MATLIYQVNTNFEFTATTTSQTLFPVNPNRTHFSIQNDGAEDVFVHFGSDDATITNGFRVSPANLYEPFKPGRGAISVIVASGTSRCIVMGD